MKKKKSNKKIIIMSISAAIIVLVEGFIIVDNKYKKAVYDLSYLIQELSDEKNKKNEEIIIKIVEHL